MMIWDIRNFDCNFLKSRNEPFLSFEEKEKLEYFIDILLIILKYLILKFNDEESYQRIITIK